jgi:hypothetical protein
MTTTTRLALAVVLCGDLHFLTAQTVLRREGTAYRGGTINTSERAASRPSNSGRRADPFQHLSDTALAKETEWLAVDRDLGIVLNREHACAPEATDAIKTAQKLQQETNAAKLEYYRQHRKREEDAARKFGAILTDNPQLLAEFDRTIQNARRQLTDVANKQAQLARGAADNGMEAVTPLKTLDERASIIRRRLENAEMGLARWKEANDDARQGQSLARERTDAFAAMENLLDAENMLWASFYRALDIRRMLKCHRDGVEVTIFEDRRPIR